MPAGRFSSDRQGSELRPTQPRYIRALNALGRRVRGLGFRGDLLRPESMLRAAERQTGLHEWGDDPFLDALEQLVLACHREGALTMLGEVALRYQIVRLLANRLRIEDAFAKTPSLRDVQLPRPILIGGLPRTGTTLLHRLLGQDPRARAPRLWEMYIPTPAAAPPGSGIDDGRAKRIRRAKSMLDLSYGIAPELRAIHPMVAEEADECHYILQHTFVTELFHVQFNVPSYQRWIWSLPHERMRQVYAYHKRFLQLLTSRERGDHLVLKWPCHLLHLDALLDVYPDHCVVQTHRSPLEVVPSTCNLFAYTRATRSDHVDLRTVGQDGVECLRELVRRSMASRTRIAPNRIFDLHYRDLVRDPVGAVQGIYAHFDLPFEPAFERAIRSWLSKNKSSGSNPYSLEQFGLDRDALTTEFAEYCERFDLSNEGSSRAEAGSMAISREGPAPSPS